MSVSVELILASASPRRLQLLAQINVVPHKVIPADINEDPLAGELPKPHALRLSSEKAMALAGSCTDHAILAADTVVAVGRRILPKTETVDEAKFCLKLLSGRAHRVYTGVTVVDKNGVMRCRVSETRLKMKRLSQQDIEDYIKSEEWQGKAGGYAIQGRAEAFIHHISGSYSGVVGLPLFETKALLTAAGIKT